MAPQKCLRFVVEFSSLESYNSSKTGSNLCSASYEDDRAPISLLGGAHSLSLPVLAWRADVRVSFLAPTDVFLVNGSGGGGWVLGWAKRGSASKGSRDSISRSADQVSCHSPLSFGNLALICGKLVSGLAYVVGWMDGRLAVKCCGIYSVVDLRHSIKYSTSLLSCPPLSPTSLYFSNLHK